MTQEQVTIWEKENCNNITGWIVEFLPNSKIITFNLEDKTKKIFEIEKTV